MNRPSILIVDQDPVTFQGLRAQVTCHGHWRVLEARDAVEAKSATARSHPGVIVIHHTKSQLDGAQLTQEILRTASDLNVLLVCDDYTMIQRAFEVGVLGYVLTNRVNTDLVPAIDQLWLGRTFFTAETIKLLRVRYHRNPYQREHPTLTQREVGILQQIAEGKTNKDIGADLGISVRTVENHRAEIMKKLNLENVTELVRYAIRNGFIEP